MTRPSVLAVVLAAGKGTRMKSARPKVLHAIAGRSLLGHVLSMAQVAGCDRLAVVIGPDMEEVRAAALRMAPEVEVYVQPEQRGTADAVLAAKVAIARHTGDIVVLYGDTPLIEPQTIGRLLAALDGGAAVAVLGFEAREPGAYGRLLTAPGGELLAIREAKDASETERAVRLCNSGVMALRLDDAARALAEIGNANAKGEYYLTDIIEIARGKGLKAAVVIGTEDEVVGVNSRAELAAAEAIWQGRARAAVMAEGATLVAPETVWLSFDTRLGRDVVIEPNVFFGPGVIVGDGAEILANCHIVGARIGPGARVGPFARMRPGADLGPKVHVGNFVEIKNAALAEGAKANHLSYLGDASVGPGANIGAGTIFCNYDGFLKHRTEIGAKAFIGSNSSLVAPVTIGEGAYIGSGSVITRDVPPDALALERGKQEERPQWAARFRALMAKRKAQRG